MEKGLNSFFQKLYPSETDCKSEFKKEKGIKKEKKRISILVKACVAKKKLEVKITEVPANSNRDLLPLGNCSHWICNLD